MYNRPKNSNYVRISCFSVNCSLSFLLCPVDVLYVRKIDRSCAEILFWGLRCFAPLNFTVAKFHGREIWPPLLLSIKKYGVIVVKT